MIPLNIINLVLGDWSHDGHGKSSISTIRSNFTKREIVRAYKKGVEKIGFNLTNEVAWENSILDGELIPKLTEAGYDISDLNEFDEEAAGITLEEEDFVDIYLFIVQLGDEDFEWKQVSHRENHIRIGGYGLWD